MLANQLSAYEESELYRLRHTAAHIMAQAVLERYPQARLGIGPPIEDGFYYDFDLGLDEDGPAPSCRMICHISRNGCGRLSPALTRCNI